MKLNLSILNPPSTCKCGGKSTCGCDKPKDVSIGLRPAVDYSGDIIVTLNDPNTGREIDSILAIQTDGRLLRLDLRDEAQQYLQADTCGGLTVMKLNR